MLTKIGPSSREHFKNWAQGSVRNLTTGAKKSAQMRLQYMVTNQVVIHILIKMDQPHIHLYQKGKMIAKYIFPHAWHHYVNNYLEEEILDKILDAADRALIEDMTSEATILYPVPDNYGDW